MFGECGLDEGFGCVLVVDVGFYDGEVCVEVDVD